MSESSIRRMALERGYRVVRDQRYGNGFLLFKRGTGKVVLDCDATLDDVVDFLTREAE